MLLGEPGLGKSTELRHRVIEANSADVAEHLLVDLATACDVADLRRKLDTVVAFASTSSRTVWLDSVDELALVAPRAGQLLASRVADIARAGTRLRVACRSAEWPVALGAALDTAFDGGSVVVFCDLVPLDRAAVSAAATHKGIEGTRFLEWIEVAGAFALAERPVTLNFLLTEHESGHLAGDMWTLYERGMLALVREPNAARRDASRSQRGRGTSASHILDVASRLAAFAILCGRPLIQWDEAPGEPSNDGTLAIDDAVVRGDVDVFTVDDVSAATATAVFQGATASTVRFAHQTFTEFLAARFLTGLNLEDDHLFRLLGLELGVPSVPTRMRELVGWVARRNTAVFEHVARTQPDLLLQFDVALLDGQARRRVAMAWLDAVRDGRISQPNMPRFGSLRALVFSGVEELIVPLIQDRDCGYLVRRTAIEIAGQSGSPPLVDVLVRVALDGGEDYDIRTAASYEVARSGTLESRRRLRPLLDLGRSADAYDELRGDALRALFPDALSWSSLLPLLRPRQRRNFGGSYSAFLHELGESPLARSDLDVLLPWLIESVSGADRDLWLRRLRAAVFLRAWEFSTETEVADALADALLHSSDRPNALLDDRDDREAIEDLRKDRTGRGRVLARLLPRWTKSNQSPYMLFHTRPRLLLGDELGLLLDATPPGSDESVRRTVDAVAARLLNSARREDMERLYELTKLDPAYVRSREWFAGCRLDGPEAAHAREESKRVREAEGARQAEEAERARAIARYPASVQEALTGAVEGDLEAWHRFCQLLRHPPHDDDPIRVTSDLAQHAGWGHAGPLHEKAISDGAAEYLARFEPTPAERLVISEESVSGDWSWMIALRWMVQHAEPRLIGLDPIVWERAARILAGHSSENEFGDDDVVRAMGLVLAKTPTTAVNVIRMRFRRGAPSEFCVLLGRIGGDAVVTCLRGAAFGDSASPAWSAVRLLLERNDTEAWERTELWMASGLGTTDEAAVACAVSAAAQAFWVDAQRTWESLRSYFSAVDPSAALSVMLALAGRHGGGPAGGWEDLAASDLAELYLWLRQHAPAVDDSDSGWVGPSHDLDRFRDTLLARIRDLGTPESVRAIERVAEALPDWWLRCMPYEARLAQVNASDIRSKPSQLRCMLIDPRLRRVASVIDLLDATRDQLRGYEEWLHGHNGAVQDLWEGRANECRRPVEETQFSAHIARYLRDQMAKQRVVVNFEVVVRLRRQDAPGERTDVLVQAIAADGSARFSVVIEVKGCWNADVLTSMREQLLDRYMKDEPGCAGLYIVGFFGPKPICRERCALTDLESARTTLQAQAAELAAAGAVLACDVIDTQLR